MVHSWMETGEIPKGRPGLTLRKKIDESGTKREELWPSGLFEVPLAYNVLTSESRAMVLPGTLEEKNAWKAKWGAEWITGTADYVGALLELPWVDDLKTGRRAEYGDYRYQQAFYSLAWTLFNNHEITPVRSTITHWPKYPIANPPGRFGALLEPEFFSDFQARLRALYYDVAKLKSQQETGMDVSAGFRDGAQCVYCPSKSNCTKGLKYERD